MNFSHRYGCTVYYSFCENETIAFPNHVHENQVFVFLTGRLSSYVFIMNNVMSVRFPRSGGDGSREALCTHDQKLGR